MKTYGVMTVFESDRQYNPRVTHEIGLTDPLLMLRKQLQCQSGLPSVMDIHAAMYYNYKSSCFRLITVFSAQ